MVAGPPVRLGRRAGATGLAADFKIIVPAAPGGGWDQLGRAVQASLEFKAYVESEQKIVLALVTNLGLVKK